MARWWIAILGVILSAATAQAKLEVELQATYGKLGQKRELHEIFREEKVFFRWQVKGVTVDSEGRPDLDEHVTVTDAAGSLVKFGDHSLDAHDNYHNKLDVANGTTRFGYLNLTFGQVHPTGDYVLTVVCRDRLNGQEAICRCDLHLVATRFAVVSPRLFLDEEKKLPSSNTITTDQRLHMEVQFVGQFVTRDGFKVDVCCQVLDQNNTEIACYSETVTNSEPSEAQARVDKYTLSGTIRHPGNYVLRVTITDCYGQKKASCELPIKVIAP